MQEFLKRTINDLAKVYDTQEAKNIALLLFEEITGLQQSRIYITDRDISHEEAKKINAAKERLLNNEPLQYVLGKAWFYGREFYVSPSVLIPRPETEELVAWIIKNANATSTILDIGTGSGCIPITIAAEINSAKVYGYDISQEAISVAQTNAAQNNVTINFERADILNWEKLPHSDRRWDIIISNPPYIRKQEAILMKKNVLEYEPHIALFVENDDPLLFYKRIVEYAVQYLNNNGLLFFEINEAFAEETIALFKKYGFVEIEIRKDLQGKNRMAKGLKA